MKKNFFKKLSFVLALAMIVSVVAPAAGAFAATDLKLNSTKKYLHLGRVESGENDFNFNINGTKQKGWKYEWTSQNEEVAVVNESNGVTTATGVGTTKVTCVIYDKDGEEVLDKPLVATVTVRDNIKDLKISNAPEKAIAVGEVKDLNRSYVTEAGLTKGSASVTRWVVDKADKAEIDDSGKFKASEAGEYKVTANAFQSKAKYEAWLVSKDATLVLDSDTVTVTVAAGIVETKQLNDTKFTVEFDSNMSATDVKTAAVLYQIINGKRVATGTEKFKSITLDEKTGKVATVEMFTALNPGTTYNFVYGELVGEFKAATKNVSDIAGIIFEDFNVNITGNTNMYDYVKAVNKDGVVILTGAAIPNLAFTYGGDLTKGYAAGNLAYIYVDKYSAPVTVKYSNYVFNDATKTYDAVAFEDAAVATGVSTDTSLNTATMQYQVGETNAVATNDTWVGTLSLAAGDNGFVQTRYKTVSASGANDPYIYTADNSVFKYVSTDTSKLVVNGTSVYAIAQGAVTVIVSKLDGTSVGTFDVLIQSSRTFGSFAQSDNTISIGNNASHGESKTVSITAKDTMGKAFVPGVSYDIANYPNGANKALVVITPSVNSDTTSKDFGKVSLAVSAKGAMAGYYNVKVTLTGFNTSRDVFFTVMVVEANTAATNTAIIWKVELSDESVDLKANYGKNVSINVYGYNGSNVRVDKLDSATDYTVEVKKGSTVVSTGTAIIPVVTATSGAAVSAYEKTSYQVVAYVTSAGLSHFANQPNRIAGSYVGAASFSVVDTTSLEKTFVTAVVAPGTILKAVQDAYDYKLNGNGITEANIINVKYTVGGVVQNSISGAVSAGQNVYVESVTYRVTDATTGAYVDYTYALGVTLAVK